MTATELQTILDREGVPVEARAVPVAGAIMATIWGNPVFDEDECRAIEENAHIGAMVRWLIGEGYHSLNFVMEGDGEHVSLELYAKTFRVMMQPGIDTTFVLLARACGAVAKEPQ